VRLRGIGVFLNKGEDTTFKTLSGRDNLALHINII
jgi:hypothetical protein